MAIAPAAFRVTKGGERFELLAEVRITPAAKRCRRSGDVLRCLSVSRGKSAVTDIDLAANTVERQVTDLPVMHWLLFHQSRFCLGYWKRAAAGNPTELFFFDTDANLVRNVRLPDAASEISQSPGMWYVGCRNGRVYAFLTRLWCWRVPCRPQRLSPAFPLIAASWRGVVVGERTRFYLLDTSGSRLWRSEVPASSGLTASVPREILGRRSELDHLGTIDDPECVPATGSLRLMLDTANPADAEANKPRFRGGLHLPSSHTKDDIRVRVELWPASDDVITGTAMSHDRIAVGTSGAELYLFNMDATLLRTFIVGQSEPVSRILLSPTGLTAAYCGGVLTMFEAERISGYVKLPPYYAEVVPCGDQVLVWSWKAAWLVDRQAHVLWKAEFSRPIGAVVPDELGFSVLAGPLFRFRQSVVAL